MLCPFPPPPPQKKKVLPSQTCAAPSQSRTAPPPRAAGVGGLLDILLEDSLEGYVFCAFFGFGVIGLIRTLKLPVVEGGSGIGF